MQAIAFLCCALLFRIGAAWYLPASSADLTLVPSAFVAMSSHDISSCSPSISILTSDPVCSLVIYSGPWQSETYPCPLEVVGSTYIACISNTFCFFTNVVNRTIVAVDISTRQVKGTIGKEELVSPSGLTVVHSTTNSYEIFVVDTGANGVWQFSWNGITAVANKIISFTTASAANGSVVVIKNSILVSLVGERRVLHYNLQGDYVGYFGPTFSYLLAIVADYSDNVFIHDSGATSVYLYSNTGVMKDIISGLDGVVGITLSRKALYFMNWGLHRSINYLSQPSSSQTNISCASIGVSISYNVSGGALPYTYTLFPKKEVNITNSSSIRFDNLKLYRNLDLPIYEDQVMDRFFDTSWGTRMNPQTSKSSTVEPHSGNFMFSFWWETSWSGYGFGCESCIDTSKYYAISFWINVGLGGQTFNVRVSNNTSNLDVALRVVPDDLPKNEWVQKTILLYDAYLTVFKSLYFVSEVVNSPTNPVYIDDVMLLSYPWDYRVRVTDSCGEETSTNFTLAVENVLEVDVASTPTQCTGTSDGILTASVSGGVPPYTYLWTIDGATINGNRTLTNLSNFGNNVIIYDNYLRSSWTLKVPPDLIHNLTDTAYYKSAPYSFSFSPSNRYQDVILYSPASLDSSKYLALEFWINGGPKGGQDLGLFTTRGGNVANHKYISDLIGYPYLLPNRWLKVTYDLSSLPTPYDEIKIDFNDQNEIATVYIDDIILISKESGPRYTLTVKDSSQCSLVSYLQVFPPIPITSVVSTTHATCHGSRNGAITVHPSGGSAPYHLRWHGNDIFSTTIRNLPASELELDVVDSHNCVAPKTTTAYILEPAALAISKVSIDYPKCHGATATISLTSVGGIGPFDFVWSATANASFTKIPQAPPTVIFADEFQNNFRASVNNEIFSFDCTKTPIAPYSGYCALRFRPTQLDHFEVGCDGCISFRKNSGIGFHIYLQEASDADLIMTNLFLQGIYLFPHLPIYNATIYGKNGTSFPSNTWVEVFYDFSRFPNIRVDQFVIFANQTTKGEVYIDNIILHVNSEQSSTLSTGIGVPEGFNSTVQGTAGTYTLNLIDENNCSFIHSFVISQPEVLTVHPFLNSPSSSRASDGYITVVASGGTPPYTYFWVGPNTTHNELVGLSYGAYPLMVTDANGCLYSTTINLPYGFATVRKYNLGLSAGLGALVAFCTGIALFATLMLVKYWKSFSTLGSFYCSVLLFGVMVSYIAASVLLPRPTDQLCTAFPWLLGIAFILVYGCLFIKTWALYRVWIAAMQYQRSNIRSPYILKILGAALLIEIIFLIIWTVLDPPRVQRTKSVDNTIELQCNSDRPIFWVIFLSVKGIWLIMGAVLSVLTRDVVKQYNESTSIAYAIYNIVVLLAIAVPLGILLEGVPGGRLVIQVVITVLAFTFTMCIMFFKAWYNALVPKPDEDIISAARSRTPTNSKEALSRGSRSPTSSLGHPSVSSHSSYSQSTPRSSLSVPVPSATVELTPLE